jgi:hypothetical protein
MIIVYILTDNPKSDRVKTVKNIFSNPIFTVSIVSVLPVDEKKETEIKYIDNETNIEYHRVIASLNDAYMNYKHNYCIVVKDTTISSTEAKTVAEVASTMEQKNNADILYLCKWNDKCHLYTNKEQVLSTGSMMVKTQSPNGIQCIMFSPNGRDIVLGKRNMKNKQKFELHKEKDKDIGYALNREVLNNNIDASCMVPNLVDYDPTAAKCDKDYNKSKECEDLSNKSTGNTGTSSFWWIIIVILIIIIIVWAIIKLRNNYY